MWPRFLGARRGKAVRMWPRVEAEPPSSHGGTGGSETPRELDGTALPKKKMSAPHGSVFMSSEEEEAPKRRAKKRGKVLSESESEFNLEDDGDESY